MKTLTLTGLLLVSLALPAFSAPNRAKPSSSLRLIETSPSFERSMLERYPDRIRRVSDKVMLVPADMLPTLGRDSHELTGHCGGFMDITAEGPRKMLVKSEEPLP